MYKNEVKHQRAIADCGAGASEEKIKARYIELGGLYVEEEGAEVETITESEAAEAVESAVSVEEAQDAGIDTDAAQAEAVPVEVTTDDTSAAPEETVDAPAPKAKGKGMFGKK